MVGRPSKRNERRQQVLAAYVSAISKHGFSGATLEAIAEEAKITRPLVRHHLGNKEAMFEQLVKHVIGEFRNQSQQLIEALPASNRIEALIDILFRTPDETAPELVFVFAELTLKSVADKALAARLAACVTEFEDALTAEVQKEFSLASNSEARALAHGIMAIYFNSISLAPLALSTTIARNAVNTLIQSLEKKKHSK